MLPEARKLESVLQLLQERFDALPLRTMLSHFDTIAQAAQPAEMQRILRATVHRLEWQPAGEHVVNFYRLPR